MTHCKFTLPVLSLLAVLTGCSNRVLFTTQTSLGLDVSGTAQVPNKVSLSYNRYEAAIVPRKSDGDSHSIFGGMDADIGFFRGSTIKQTFATGEAAKLATEPEPTASVTSTNQRPSGQGSKQPLLFLTGTTFGLHLSAGEGELAPNLLMGYRRSEATVIPITPDETEVRSVFADILINSKDKPATDPEGISSLITTNFPATSGVRIKQSFATGRAAENIAGQNDEARAVLRKAAGVAPAAPDSSADAKTITDLIKKPLTKSVTANGQQFSGAQTRAYADALAAAQGTTLGTIKLNGGPKAKELISKLTEATQ